MFGWWKLRGALTSDTGSGIDDLIKREGGGDESSWPRAVCDPPPALPGLKTKRSDGFFLLDTMIDGRTKAHERLTEKAL